MPRRHALSVGHERDMDVECEAIDHPCSVSLVFLSVYLIKYRCFVSGEGAPGRATPHRVSKKKMYGRYKTDSAGALMDTKGHLVCVVEI